MTETYPPPGTVALVTGASSGIGAATARALVAAGCRVICAARRLETLEELAAELGDAACALRVDVTDDASVLSLPRRLPSGWRDIGILVNNAGHDIGGRRPFHEGDTATWLAILDTNVAGVVRVTRALIDGMLARDRGHIVNVGSIAGQISYATGTLYAASKHAVHGFSESLRKDYADTGVRVTEIMPGMVRTDFAATRFDDPDRAAQFYDEFGVCLVPEDIARTIVFAVQQPPHVAISQLVVVPTGRAPGAGR